MYSLLFRVRNLNLLVALGLSWSAVHGQTASTSTGISVCFTKAQPDTTVPCKGDTSIEVNHAGKVYIVLEIPPGMAKAVLKIQWCARTVPELPCSGDPLEYDYEPQSGEKWKRVFTHLPNFEGRTGKSYITVSLNNEVIGQSEPIQIEEKKREEKP